MKSKKPKALAAWQKAVVKEHNDLAKKIINLQERLNDCGAMSVVHEKEVPILKAQLSGMEKYDRALLKRIALWQREEI
jgi:hypothetical protein